MSPEAALTCGPAGFSSICRLGFSHRSVIFFGGLLPGCGEQLPGGRVIYHPEGIVLPMSPASALVPIFEASQAATLEVTGTPGVTSTPGLSWVLHVTLCYSTSQQPAAPIIAALGRSLSAREVTIDKLNLVIQHGPALSWDWRPIGTAHLGRHSGSSLRHA